MVVAADFRGPQEYRGFIYETFTRIVEQHPHHSFIFFANKPFDISFISSENVITVIVKTAKISLFSNRKISFLLKKYRADVVVTAKLFPQTKVPQCLIADNATSNFSKAKTVVVASEFAKRELIKKYTIDDGRIEVVYRSANNIFQPIKLNDKEKIKEQYSERNEYFLVSGKLKTDILLNVFKAFSVFKKMQKSNMQLLIILSGEPDKGFSEALQFYKFKDEVKILENISKPETAKITASAYAYVYPYAWDYFYVLEAMNCDVPVITCKHEEILEVCKDGALYHTHNDISDIADKMMLIYKHENLRQQLIEKGKEQVKKYSRDNSANLLWNSIENSCR